MWLDVKSVIGCIRKNSKSKPWKTRPYFVSKSTDIEKPRLAFSLKASRMFLKTQVKWKEIHWWKKQYLRWNGMIYFHQFLLFSAYCDLMLRGMFTTR